MYNSIDNFLHCIHISFKKTIKKKEYCNHPIFHKYGRIFICKSYFVQHTHIRICLYLDKASHCKCSTLWILLQ